MFGFSPFSESPISAVPLNHYSFICNSGSYTFTGSAATFVLNQTLKANAGSYSFTGNSATFTYNQTIHAGAFSFIFTGSPASFIKTSIVSCNAGSYTFTGNTVSFIKGKTLSAQNGSYLFTGNAASFTKSLLVNGQPGSYEFSASNAEFVKGKGLIALKGSYVFTGSAAHFEYVPNPVAFVESKGGLPKEKRKTKADIEKERREELEAIVKREFDILDGTYVPEAVQEVKETILPKIKEIDYAQYAIALAQVNELLLQAKIRAAEYEAELDDEEALLMLL